MLSVCVCLKNVILSDFQKPDVPSSCFILLCSFSQSKLCWYKQHLHKGDLYIFWYIDTHIGLEVGSVGWIRRERIFLFLLILRPLPHYSHWTTGWGDRKGKRGSERGIIEVHALCIISYSEEDSAASGNESGQQCNEVNAVNANEGAEFAGRSIWLKSPVMANTAQWCYQQKHTESKGRRIEERVLGYFWLKIKDLIADNRATDVEEEREDVKYCTCDLSNLFISWL